MAQLPDGDEAPRDGALPASSLDVRRPLSLYIHVPFCRVRCGYCDFNTYTPAELGDLSPDTYLGAGLQTEDVIAQVDVAGLAGVELDHIKFHQLSPSGAAASAET